jgi:hypothetical protein
MFIKIIIFLVFLLPANIFAQNNDIHWRENYRIGEKYHIWHYRANIRHEPTRNSNIIAILSINDQIEIIENTYITEEINDTWGYWVKIKYGNIIGFTFSGNIADKTLVVDVDNNGVNDYFHFRNRYYKHMHRGTVGNSIHGHGYFSFEVLSRDSRKDFIFMINDQRINTDALIMRFSSGDIIYPYDEYGNYYSHRNYFEYYSFTNCNNYVLIELSIEARDSVWHTIYKVNGNGVIEHLRVH